MHEIRQKRDDFVFLTGTEEILLPSFFMGADGGIVATSGIVPETVVALYNAFQKGDYKEAKRIQYELLPLIALMFTVDFPDGFRIALELRGFDVGHGRQPLSETYRTELKNLQKKLAPLVDRLVSLV